MSPATLVPLFVAIAGAAVAAAGWVLLRASGARPGMARRLGGAREIKVGRLLDIGPDDDLPRRPVRVVGRIRCGAPLAPRPSPPPGSREPLVVLPHVWEGPPDELGEVYAPAVARITAEDGPPSGARAATRMLSGGERLMG